MTTEVETSNKTEESFRNYTTQEGRVFEFYKANHINQTYEYVQKMHSQIFPLGRWKLDIFEVISLLDEIADQSDPDNDKKQIVHALQTGEACRKAYPNKDWFHLMGFIHDLGKVLNHPKMHNLPQWCVVGDTFPVGCAFSDTCVYPEFFEANPDSKNDEYSTKLGIYKENIGFDNVMMSFGHDEYLYQVLKNNQCTLPEEALYVIRYHSFYPWHNKGGYDYLANDKDRELLQFVQEFQKCDLYSKVDEELDVEELLPYYQGLIKKYFPSNVIDW
jgi:inositol oxygenase